MADRDAVIRQITTLHSNGKVAEAYNLASQAGAARPGDLELFDIIHAIRQELLVSRQNDQLGEIAQNLRRTAHTTYQALVRELQADRRYDDPLRLERHGFSVGSQNEEDGLLAEVFRRIGETSRTCFEFGVGSGQQNNTFYFLLNGWRSWWIEINPQKVAFIRRHFAPLIAQNRLILDDTPVDAENIDAVCVKLGIPQTIDLLSIDIDGNDYHVFAAMTKVLPRVVIMEYNGSFPPPMRIVGAYDLKYRYAEDTYIGTSLQSLTELAEKKGYQLVGCGITGLNCIFVRKDLAQGKFATPATAEHLYNLPRHQLAWGGAFGVGPRVNYGPTHNGL